MASAIPFFCLRISFISGLWRPRCGRRGSASAPVINLGVFEIPSSPEALTLALDLFLLFPVGHPDVLHLVGVLEIPPPFALLFGEKIDLAPLVRPNLLPVSYRECLRRRAHFLVAITTDGVQV